MAGSKNIQRQGISPLKNKPKSEEVKVRLKNPPTFLPLSLEEEVLAIKIRLKGIMAAPDIPAKIRAAKRAYKLGAKPDRRLAKEKMPIQEKSILLKSRLLASGP